MTWKEFKDEVEAYGVRDDDLIRYIDVHHMGLNSHLNVVFYEDLQADHQRWIMVD